METITNLASTAATTASKLIYGEQPTDADKKAEIDTKNVSSESDGKEPLSGQQGKGTASEPFDQGNLPTPLATSDNKSTFLDYQPNETTGKEPISGQQGKGTVSEPFDQGNNTKATASSSTSNGDFLKLNPVLDGPQPETKVHSSGDPKIYTSRDDPTYTGMPIVPLDPDVATSGPGATTSSPSAIETSTTSNATGITDKVWKENPLDDISRSGAPGAGPSAPAHVTSTVPTSGLGSTTTSPDPTIKTSAPDSVTAASDAYSSGLSKSAATPVVGDKVDSKVSTENTAAQTTPVRDGTPAWTDTGVPSKIDPSSSTGSGVSKSAEEKHSRKSETGTSPSNDDKSGKMSHLKEKLKDKLHIGSKDK